MPYPVVAASAVEVVGEAVVVDDALVVVDETLGVVESRDSEVSTDEPTVVGVSDEIGSVVVL